MKKLSFIFALPLVFVSILIGCGVTGSNSGSNISTLFYTNAGNTTPVFVPQSAQVSSRKFSATPWGSGNQLYSVYFSLREFLPARDEGAVDRANLYKLIYDVDTVFSGLSREALAITQQQITSPFGQMPAVLCDQALNDAGNRRAIGYKETAAEINAILSWIWTDATPQKAEYGIAEVSYNKSSRDLTIDMTYSVDYDTTNTRTDYNLRCQVAGNAASNTFEYKYIIGDTKIVAKGISRGAGNYMLFKYAQSSEAASYIVVPAESGEDFFISQNTAPTLIYTATSELPASVEAYLNWVSTTDFLSSEALVSDISLLNTGNTKSGTIYLNYN